VERAAEERVAAERAAAAKAVTLAAQRAAAQVAERARAQERAVAERAAAKAKATAAAAEAVAARARKAATLQDALDEAFARAEQVGVNFDTLDRLEDMIEAGELSAVDARVELLQLEAAALQAAAQAGDGTTCVPGSAAASSAGEAALANEAPRMGAASQSADAQSRAVASAAPGMERVQIIIPNGVGPGDMIRVRSAWGGEFDVQVPAGLGSGDALAFDLPAAPPSA
jgi:chemotaxis protein histidine kinase CheA